MNMQRNNGEEPIGSFYMGRMRPPPQRPRRLLPRGVLTVIALLCFAAIIWYAYPQGQEKYEGADIPVIKADAAPYKFKPENPGGMEVRHQDSTIFDPLEKKPRGESEKVLAAPEAPVDKDEAVKETAKLDTSAPQLNLNTQMQKVAEGTEKIVLRPKKKEAATDVAKPVAKPGSKAAVKNAPAKKEAVAKAAAPSTPVVWDVYIRLGSYRNVSGANEDWEKLLKKFPQYLGTLSMRVVKVDLGAKGVFNRLEAGKLPETRAGEICKAIASPGGCVVVK
jgi:hypothetical protein